MEKVLLRREAKRKLILADRKATVAQILCTIVASRKEQKHLRMQNTSNPAADGLQQPKTTLGSTFVAQEQKAENAGGHRLTKTGQLKTGKNVAWSDDSRFLLRLTDGRVRI